VFYGRARAYTGPLRADDAAKLAEVLHRNVFAGAGERGASGLLAGHALHLRRHLHERPIGPILSGEIDFPDP
jgi:hypothetical protein